MIRNQQDVSVCLWLTEENQEECLQKLLAVAKTYDNEADVAIADTLDSEDDEDIEPEDEDKNDGGL